MLKLNRWLRSKTGGAVIIGALALLLVVAVLGQQLGWWEAMGLTGAAGVTITLPPVQYPDPQGGYTCLPTCAENDAKMFTLVGENMKSLSGIKIVTWIGVPGNASSFQIGIFDGDSGKDNTGAVNYKAGNWDSTEAETTYTLYADPMKDGAGSEVIAVWHGNADPMPNNAWYDITIDQSDLALAPSRHYFYRLEAERGVAGSGINAFKLRSTGYLSTGKSMISENPIGIVGMVYNTNDAKIVYPEWQSVSNPGPSNYTGDWDFSIYVPEDEQTFEIWDGDFDRGTRKDLFQDTDDPNTTGKPSFANQYTVDEGVGGMGAPADNYTAFPLYLREPPVRYELIDPGGAPIYTDEEPSGTEEWERFVLSTQADQNPDLLVDRIQPGFYILHIQGLDLYNSVWLSTNFEVCDPVSGCGPCVWPGCNASACPRTIGYWKNNVKKVYINQTTKGVQEGPETLDAAFRAVALASPIFRSGLVDWIVENPTAAAIPGFADATPLSPQEAHTILQKETEFGNSMLGRALQQNLATWLNLASGKISDNAVVSIDVPSGTFTGTMLEALLEAQNIMINGGDIERAKDIADMINNGQINSDPDSNVDSSGNPMCTIYTQVLPGDKQPKKYDELPKAPKPQDPGPYQPEEPADPNTCNAISNTYGVENPTFNPFYSIKFEYKSGTEVKDSGFDEFKYTLTQEQVASMTTMQLEAKAGEDVGQVTMECSFNDGLPCGPVMSENMLFAFAFVGATDNGDGTMTLTFQVQNYSSHGLSHASFGLPEGAVPTMPSGAFESKVCQPE